MDREALIKEYCTCPTCDEDVRIVDCALCGLGDFSEEPAEDTQAIPSSTIKQSFDWYCNKCGERVYSNPCVKCAHDNTIRQAELKSSNPKDAIASNKLPLHLVPQSAVAIETLAYLDGAMKYGRSNWRVAGVRSSVYYDAAMRHLIKWFEGEDVDPESGVPHLGHVRACIGILIDAGSCGKLTDDRAYPGSVVELINAAPTLVKDVKEKHEDKKPKHYTIADKERPSGSVKGFCSESWDAEIYTSFQRQEEQEDTDYGDA